MAVTEAALEAEWMADGRARGRLAPRLEASWAVLPAKAAAKSVTVAAPGALPCPFCGSADVHNWASDDHGPGCWSMMCFGCECEGPHTNSEAESVRLWNMRAGPP